MEFKVNKVQKWVWIALILVLSFFLLSGVFKVDYSAVGNYVTVGILSVIVLFLGYLGYKKWVKK